MTAIETQPVYPYAVAFLHPAAGPQDEISLVSRVVEALDREELYIAADDFAARARETTSYDELLELAHRTVTVI